MTLWSIFWRTFAAAALTVMTAALGWDWTAAHVAVNATQMGVLLLVAAVTALSAVGWAFVRSPAATATAKAIRSLVESVVVGVAALGLNAATDWVATSRLIVPLVIGAVLHFAVTYFQNQGAVPVQPQPLPPGRG